MIEIKALIVIIQMILLIIQTATRNTWLIIPIVLLMAMCHSL